MIVGHPGLPQIRLALGMDGDCLVCDDELTVVLLLELAGAVLAEVEDAEVGE